MSGFDTTLDLDEDIAYVRDLSMTWPGVTTARRLADEIDRLRDTLTATENALREVVEAADELSNLPFASPHGGPELAAEHKAAVRMTRAVAAARVVVSADPTEED